jgi:hypothetical protein
LNILHDFVLSAFVQDQGYKDLCCSTYQIIYGSQKSKLYMRKQIARLGNAMELCLDAWMLGCLWIALD